MKIPLFILLVALCWATFAQNINNRSFESWQFGGIIQYPTGWSTSNAFTALDGIYSVNPDTSSYDSFYSVKISTEMLGNPESPFTGFIVNGQLDVTGQNDYEKLIYAGEPYPYSPSKLTGYYKYTSTSVIEDWGHAFVILKKYNSATGTIDTIGLGANTTLNPSQNFKKFEVPLYYLKTDIPDSIVVAFFSSYPQSPNSGGTLWIDHISFEFVASNGPIPNPIRPVCYPNPASETLVIRDHVVKKLTVYDVHGQMIISSENTNEINIAKLLNGIYFLRIETDNGILSESFIKK